MDTVDPAVVLFGKTRRRLLALFYTRPDESFHLREASRISGSPAGAVRRELNALTRCGLLKRDARGNQVIFQVHSASPIYPEMQRLVIKTVGAADVVREALLPLGARIKAAWIFGSFASGSIHAESDVDLMIVGSASFTDVVKALRRASERVGRVINPTVYTPREFDEKRRRKDHFITSVLSAPSIPLVGNVNEFGAIREERLAGAPPNLFTRGVESPRRSAARNQGRKRQRAKHRRKVSARI
jgi:predicted nucleotidyltransferase